MTNTEVFHETALSALLNQRHSCRAFLPDTVPDSVLTALLETAQRTASWCNAQSWNVDITGPETTSKLSAALLDSVRSRSAGGSDIPPPREYVEQYLQRRRASGFALYGALGIGREDREERTRQMMRNYEFFGAPHVIIVSSPEALGPYGYVDCGGYVANLLNAAQALGLGAIAQAAPVLRPEAVRSVLNISPDQHLVCAVAVGYADEAHPANSFRTERADLAEVVTRHP